MTTKELHIKNMVCNRCVKVVHDELEKLGCTVHSVELGKAVVSFPEEKTLEPIKMILEENGFELIEDKKAQLVDTIKTTIIELIYQNKLEEMNVNFSDYLAEKLDKDYHYLTSLFSSMTGITIEKFFILQRVERVKEWLFYNDFTLSEMAFKLGYSSVAHLSNQFKQVTGLTPTLFKKLKIQPRKPLDQLSPH
ncbi:MAG: AraC family transcriptional regulator [Ignavibacteria bacterium CG_4_8_14_3_um_filter_37_9]|nr:AraC family transcriptional regulator [Ignavibacteria bacterium]OIO17705.1 MAG: AraC family transcriptional regulator [Ignavibacteria bacterium CG1_02_37_35]PIP79646.1 MAG: AraC family transcriptional regulator [Ignavibacteria bacterium CG22_combo_CG10-13_8_21_14_all_37_15]PIS44502.1 MAG: AraC family transcriptional regulator [Ignavibacteria bacterium CG08_land_8_20_14_0_20_37_9]PIW97968.1 MAG: AraC family transcriptional regulator [Ignavibacteria bacterium CG_4_8_14_3_um_filter_37_9]PIX943